MKKVLLKEGRRTASVAPARGGSIYDWQRWAPYAAVAWSLLYAALGIYWVAGGGGFPYTAEAASNPLGPLVGRFGPGVGWVVVIVAGIPAVAMGAAMLSPTPRSGDLPLRFAPGTRRRGVRSGPLRSLFITAGVLLAAVLLLLMVGLELLIALGYVPITLFRLFSGGDASFYLKEFAQWTVAHQVLCLIGGFLWLGATVSYARRSADACLYCGRRDGPEGWRAPESAARWGRIAVYVAMIAPLFYALTRYAWAAGIPLGMTEAYWRAGQERGTWISGLFLASFALVGGLVMLGLVQRWGEVFPRWMIGLSGRRVPIALAAVPAALVSVLLVVGGIVIWSGIPQMLANAQSVGMGAAEVRGAILIQLGPTLLFPVWGVALAVATLGYYYRRRGPCAVCGRGASSEAGEPPQS